jgi:heme-degrading monooxygenase HmoA
MPVTLINCFEVPAGGEDDFLNSFQAVNAYMRSKPGYISHRLHRSLQPDARYRFVNVVQWASLDDFRNAHDENFRAMISQPQWSAFRSTPAVYEVVHQASAQE